jgi:iron complex transport system ATP-binding protein
MLQHETVAFPFTAFEVARLGLEGVSRGLSGPDRDRIARRAMHATDVAHLAGRPIASLSGGEAQRVRFARALAQIEAGRTACGTDRQVVFLDEPVASLDLAHQLRLVDEAARLARSGRAVVAILHDLQLAAHCADRILVMNAGRRVAEGAPRDVLTPAIVAAAFGVALVRPSLPDLPWRPLGRAGAAPSAAHGP